VSADLPRRTPIGRALSAVQRSWKWIFGITLAVAVITAAALMFVPNTYTADALFYPETRGTEGIPSGVAGLAAQIGVSVGSEPTQSPQFYADLVRSRSMTDRLLLEKYPGSPHGKEPFRAGGTVIDLLKIKGRNADERMAYGRQMVAALSTAAIDRKDGTVRLTFKSTDREFSAWATNQLVRYLNEFNQKTRQSRGRAQRVFAEQRAREANEALSSSEDALREFYDANRGWQSSPRLTVQEGRLRRNVQLASELTGILARQAENAKLTEASDLPVLTVIDSAVPPALKSGPLRRLTLMGVVALVVLVMIAIALVREYAAELRAEVPELWEMTSALRRRVPERRVS
jgi:uncharacterized protein involved in exopolysaccharide biosynthesis